MCIGGEHGVQRLRQRGTRVGDHLQQADRGGADDVGAGRLRGRVAAELLDAGGSAFTYAHARASGHEWLRRLAAHFRSAVWLNPEPERFWAGTTIEVIASVFAMYPLTLDGLAHGVRHLVRGGERPRVGDPARWMKAMVG